jgi:hypothetical protein
MFSFLTMMAIDLICGWPKRNENTLSIRVLRLGVWTSLLTYGLFAVSDELPMWTKPGFLI